jgi:hypothetical protein
VRGGLEDSGERALPYFVEIGGDVVEALDHRILSQKDEHFFEAFFVLDKQVDRYCVFCQFDDELVLPIEQLCFDDLDADLFGEIEQFFGVFGVFLLSLVRSTLYWKTPYSLTRTHQPSLLAILTVISLFAFIIDN